MDETREDRTIPDITPPMPGGTVPTAEGVTLRFGPGVPASLAETWRQERPQRRRSIGRRVVGVLVTLAIAVLAAVIVWILLRKGGPAVRVTSVSVHAPSAVQTCDTTVTVVATIRTNGGGGNVAYRWRRSDGQVSGVLTEGVHKGQRSVRVPLRWTIKGSGSMNAVATLEIVEPRGSVARGSAGFEYACS